MNTANCKYGAAHRSGCSMDTSPPAWELQSYGRRDGVYKCQHPLRQQVNSIPFAYVNARFHLETERPPIG